MPGRQAANLQSGRQQLNAMAAQGHNPPQPQPLQGADPALVQILQMMQNRDANRDNSRKHFLMFPKESFTGEDKKRKQKVIGLSFLNILIIKINKEPSQEIWPTHQKLSLCLN